MAGATTVGPVPAFGQGSWPESIVSFERTTFWQATAAPRLDIRQAPVEFTTWRVRNVLLSQVDFAWDKDAVLVLSDGASSLTAALPSPVCVRAASPFQSSIASARAALRGAGEVVTVDGVGFIDPGGRVGLHPVLAVCAGRDCQLR